MDIIPIAARAMTKAEAQMASSGYRIEHSFTPVDEFDRIRNAGKGYLTPMLSPEENDFCESEYSWITVLKGDATVGCLGLRRFSLGDEAFSDFWTRTMNRHYGSTASSVVRQTSPILDRDMSNNSVYFGDLFVNKDAAGFKLFRYLVFYAIGYATLKWQPDCLFAFITQKNYDRGIKSAFNFTVSLPGVVEWEANGFDRHSSEVCIALPKNHAKSVLEKPKPV